MDAKLIIDGIGAGATVAIAGTGAWALFYASGQLKESREAERVKHLLTFVREFDTEPMVNWRKSVAEKYLKGDDPFPDAERLLDFFETISLLVRRDYLDANDVWNMFGIWMFGVYATFRDDIEQMQKDDATYYEDFCTLLSRLTAIERARGQNADRPSKEDLTDFWEGEKALVPVRPRKKRKRKPTHAEEK